MIQVCKQLDLRNDVAQRIKFMNGKFLALKNTLHNPKKNIIQFKDFVNDVLCIINWIRNDKNNINEFFKSIFEITFALTIHLFCLFSSVFRKKTKLSCHLSNFHTL